MDRNPYEGKEVIFHELHRHFKTGELSVDDDGKIDIYLDVEGKLTFIYLHPSFLKKFCVLKRLLQIGILEPPRIDKLQLRHRNERELRGE